MSIKPTMSRDGQSRVTIRVEHRLGRAEFVNALAGALFDTGDEEPVSAARALDIVRRFLSERGADWWSWTEEVDAYEVEACQALAERSTQRFWAQRRSASS